MIFSKLGRPLSRSSHSINILRAGNGGVVRSSAAVNNIEGGFIDGRGGLGLLRGFLTSIGNRGTQKPFLSDLNSILANPRIRRFLSTEAPKKKNYENFYPKGKKEVPKGEKQKSESKENSSNADHDESDFNKRTFMKAFYLLAPLFVAQLLFYPFSFGDGDKQQISFQEFKNRLLEAGLVDHIVVSNKSVAKVYVKSSPLNQTSDDIVQGPVNGIPARGHGGQYKYYFTIGSVDTFEEKLEEAQEAMGIDPHNYVPVTYASEMVWYQELMRFAPTLLLLGTLMYMGRRMQGGLGVGGGGGGKGGRGIFNIGKAHVTKADKNSKNKIYFKDVAGCDEAKQEIMEFVHFLKSPKKYEELGAKIPKRCSFGWSSRNWKDPSSKGNCWGIWCTFSIYIWFRFHGDVCWCWTIQGEKLVSRSKAVCSQYHFH
ncbi:ATP-DEPENDENT ZINC METALLOPROTEASE FTSH 3 MITOCHONDRIAL [Salix purpurea]|uniref:ATP-DEPENDENT ZINC METALLOPROTEASE FTSH 3 MITOCHONDRIAL n=1 Tax=Salix purpurea TaxID=77065 RepID=A0A9Q0PP53_SALPP|nr:ATP-DEPENDENT ZINC METALLOPROTEASE FTSH 3 MITOCHONDRIAL [Salix purpurea]